MDSRTLFSESLFLKKSALYRFANTQDSPFFLYDEQSIRKKAEEITSAFSFCSFRPYFPVHCNPNPTILSILREHQFGVWCENGAELALCKSCGFSGDAVLFAPYIPMPEAESLAESMHATYVITGRHSLPTKPMRRLMLSYKPDSRLINDGKIYSGFEHAKQGLSEQDLVSLAQHCKQYGTESIGIFIRSVSTERQTGYLAAVLKSLLALSQTLQKTTDISVSQIHLGDGLYLSYKNPENNSDCAQEARQVADVMTQFPPETAGIRLSICAGKWLLSQAGIFVTRIAAVYPQERPLLITEAASSQLSDCSMLGNPHEISVLSSSQQKEYLFYDVCGCQFLNRKNFADKKLLPACDVGDYLVFHNAGADCRVLSQPLLGYPPCNEFLLQQDGSIVQI